MFARRFVSAFAVCGVLAVATAWSPASAYADGGQERRGLLGGLVEVTGGVINTTGGTVSGVLDTTGLDGLVQVDLSSDDRIVSVSTGVSVVPGEQFAGVDAGVSLGGDSLLGVDAQVAAADGGLLDLGAAAHVAGDHLLELDAHLSAGGDLVNLEVDTALLGEDGLASVALGGSVAGADTGFDLRVGAPAAPALPAQPEPAALPSIDPAPAVSATPRAPEGARDRGPTAPSEPTAMLVPPPGIAPAASPALVTPPVVRTTPVAAAAQPAAATLLDVLDGAAGAIDGPVFDRGAAQAPASTPWPWSLADMLLGRSAAAGASVTGFGGRQHPQVGVLAAVAAVGAALLFLSGGRERYGISVSRACLPAVPPG